MQQKKNYSYVRATQRKLCHAFRSAIAAQTLGYAPDLTPLTTELANLPAPQDRQAARRYANTVIPAAKALFAQGDLDTARSLLMDVVPICRQYSLIHQELKATARLVAMLRQQELLVQARELLEHAIETTKTIKRMSYKRKFEQELAVVTALIAHRESVRSDNDRVYFKEETDHDLIDEQEFTVKQLDSAEAVGARWARLRKTVFDRDSELSSRDPRRTGGRRKAVFVSTLLKKGLAAWMRKSDND